jgi:hypothetical protein
MVPPYQAAALFAVVLLKRRETVPGALDGTPTRGRTTVV